MSYIEKHLGTTRLSPWGDAALIGWACQCGAEGDGWSYSTDAPQHLIDAHGAPAATSGDCACGGYGMGPSGPSAQAGDEERRHRYQHRLWLLGVWDA